MKKIKKQIKKKKVVRQRNKGKSPKNSPKYRPTLAEQKLLDVLLNPEHRFKTKTAICEIARIDRKTMRKAFQKPGFCEIYDHESKVLVRQAKALIINASIHQAVRGDATHAKMLLSMDGIYQGDKHIFPGKDGKPQDLTPQPLSNNEIVRRLDVLIKTGLRRKEEAEKNAAGK